MRGGDTMGIDISFLLMDLTAGLFFFFSSGKKGCALLNICSRP